MNESNIYFLNIYYKCQQRRKYLEPEPEAIVVVVKHRNAKEKVLLCAEVCHHVNIHPRHCGPIARCANVINIGFISR